MEEDFSDFRNGEVAQQVEHTVEARGVSGSIPDLPTGILPYPENDITWTALWSEEVLDLADQAAKCYGVVMTGEEIEAWADKLAWKCAQLND